MRVYDKRRGGRPRAGLLPGRLRRECRDPMTPRTARVVCVAGARPNYMKVKPVMDALTERGAEVILVHTGQHYGHSMNDVFFTDLRIRRPDCIRGIG